MRSTYWLLIFAGAVWGQETFTTEVAPILKRRCVACHGAAMQTNGLRVDDGAALIAGMYWYGAMSEQEMMAVPKVSVPTTFVWGDRDIAISSTAAYACSEHVTGEFEFRVLEGCGHWLPDEDPAAVIDAITTRVG